MVTKSKLVILFQTVFVVIFALGMLFPAGMVVSAEDLPPTETAVEETPPEEPPPETETVVTPPEEVVVPAAEEPAAEPVVEPPAVEEVPPVVDPALVPEILPTEEPLLVPAVLPAATEGESSEEELDTPAEVLDALPVEAELVVLGETARNFPWLLWKPKKLWSPATQCIVPGQIYREVLLVLPMSPSKRQLPMPRQPGMATVLSMSPRITTTLATPRSILIKGVTHL